MVEHGLRIDLLAEELEDICSLENTKYMVLKGDYTNNIPIEVWAMIADKLPLQDVKSLQLTSAYLMYQEGVEWSRCWHELVSRSSWEPQYKCGRAVSVIASALEANNIRPKKLSAELGIMCMGSEETMKKNDPPNDFDISRVRIDVLLRIIPYTPPRGVESWTKERWGPPRSSEEIGIIRHVKCDERKPACVRCENFGVGFCDGYDTGATRPVQTPAQPPEQRLILPKARPIIRKDSPARGPNVQNFENHEEYRYFLLYIEDIAPHLSLFNSSVWKSLLLQASHDKPFIRHAVVALSALTRTFQNRQLRRFPPTMTNGSMTSNNPVTTGMIEWNTDPDTNTPIRSDQYVRVHYDKFLEGIRKHISEVPGEEGRRIALIACLLVICIENMQFHHQTSHIHTRTGVEIMHEFMKETTQTGKSRNEGIVSPAPQILEDELVQQFGRLEIVSLAIFDLRTVEDHARLKRDGEGGMKNMPAVFTRIEEARLFLELITRRSYHFMADAIAVGVVDAPPEILDFKDPESKSKEPGTAGSTPGSFNGGKSVPKDEKDALEIEQSVYMSEIHRWSKSFDPLFKTATRNISVTDSLRALLLKIHSLALQIKLLGHLSTTEMIFDGMTKPFSQIVSLSKAVFKHPDSEKVFGEGSFIFDMGLIYPLLTVAISCRDRAIRRDAIALLRTRPWREANWGSLSGADIAQWHMEVEEEGCQGLDIIPEYARAKITKVDVHLERQVAELQAMRGFGESVVFVDTQRDWSGMSPLGT
ncbi:hypothetical protein B7494_g3728 [Chlorociboria aeruginascens]|nr:hypothetical protein B7494_g3728 [Chlorociboria aeruginascens]